MYTDVWAGRWAVDGEGWGGGDAGTFDAKYWKYIEAVIRYSTVHYSTVQYSTVQYSTVQYITVQYSI